ncbi:methylaspartate mutase [Natronosporangium hydrolyticum]|uniref:Methylaspartate mutase n=1 Tax=Natronosporangium hydrolyticum TaxID=2811111 RepID=A0A895YNU1_9ACTN|nr:methylaspartate mutase [Natronosporangium hydrolyticum]
MLSTVRRPPARRSFGDFVRRANHRGELVVQPRMGFGEPARMRSGLAATRAAAATTVGTITVDSYTRLGELAAAAESIRTGQLLNGYPLASHPIDTTRAMLAGIAGDGFPVQVRHGSANPRHIFAALIAAGLDATEGGPVSYCLPYGRVPLVDSVRHWRDCCELFARLQDRGVEPHLETFAGCMLGQLCPPSQLIALSVLEAMFFRQHGLRCVSVSYAQQTNQAQDREAVAALRRLCRRLLPDLNWHVVIYAYMGVYPTSPSGARRLLAHAAELAAESGAERLIVKTVVEAVRIPTIEENRDALEVAAATARATARVGSDDEPGADSQIYQEAVALIEAVLELDTDVGAALRVAFLRGYLDIPFCLHPDNRGQTRSYLDDSGRLRWADIGKLPLGTVVDVGRRERVDCATLMASLSYMRQKYDGASGYPGEVPELSGPARPKSNPARVPIGATAEEESQP